MAIFYVKITMNLTDDADHKEFNLKMQDLRTVGAALDGQGTALYSEDDCIFLTSEFNAENMSHSVQKIIHTIRDNAMAAQVADTVFVVRSLIDENEAVTVDMSDVA